MGKIIIQETEILKTSLIANSLPHIDFSDAFILRERLRAIAYQLFPQYVTSSLFESIAEAKNSYAEVLQSHQSWIAKIKKSNEKFLAAS